MKAAYRNVARGIHKINKNEKGCYAAATEKIHYSGSYVYGGIFQPFLFLEMLQECFRKDSETIYIGHRTVM